MLYYLVQVQFPYGPWERGETTLQGTATIFVAVSCRSGASNCKAMVSDDVGPTPTCKSSGAGGNDFAKMDEGQQQIKKMF